MKHCFDIHGQHIGWIEDARSTGRTDWTDTAPPSAPEGKTAFWTGSAWEIRDRIVAPEIAAAAAEVSKRDQAISDMRALDWATIKDAATRKVLRDIWQIVRPR